MAKVKKQKFPNSPYAVRKYKDLLKLRTDGWGSKTHWSCFNSEKEFVITKQKSGEPSTESIKIPAHLFRKLVDWYIKEQKLRKR